MFKIVKIIVMTCAFLFSFLQPSTIQLSRLAIAGNTVLAAQRSDQPDVMRNISAQAIREKLLNSLDRMPADRKFEFDGHQLSAKELQAELQKLNVNAVPLRQIDVNTLRKETERQQRMRVKEVNERVSYAVKVFNKKQDLRKTGAVELVRSPHIDMIKDKPPAYIPGMRILIQGSGFVAYSATNYKPPKVMMKYNRAKAQNLIKEIPVIYDVSSPTLLVASLPEDLGGIIDQTVQLFVQVTVPGGDVKKSNEVSIPLVAKRVVQTIGASVVSCYQAWKACDEFMTPELLAANWSICGGYSVNKDTVPYNGYSNSRLAASQKVGGYSIRTYHETRCLYGDLASSIDIYQFPLYNGYVVKGITSVSGSSPSSAVPLLQLGSNRGVLQVWGIIKTILYYGINIAVEGPAGVPYNENW